MQFELLEPARTSNLAWLERRACTVDAYAFPSHTDDTKHLSTCQYARLVDEWVTGIGLRREDYGTYRSGGRKCRSSIVRPAICARSRYCPVTRSLRQTFDARSVKQGRAMTIFAPAARKADRRLGCCGRRQIFSAARRRPDRNSSRWSAFRKKLASGITRDVMARSRVTISLASSSRPIWA